MEALEDGRFQDSKWVENLLRHFAEYYFDALDCYECSKETAPIWCNVHDITRDRSLHEIQYLLIGVNAHINYDLVFAIYDVLKEEWPNLSEELRTLRYEDHCQVNEVIAESIDEVQDTILEPESFTMKLIDSAFGRVDEYLLSVLIRKWRQTVWDNVTILLDFQSESEADRMRHNLEQSVIRRTHQISLVI